MVPKGKCYYYKNAVKTAVVLALFCRVASLGQHMQSVYL